jgi:hypothetical protein
MIRHNSPANEVDSVDWSVAGVEADSDTDPNVVVLKEFDTVLVIEVDI